MILYGIFLLLIGICIGYMAGRRQGKKTGILEGRAENQIQLLTKAYQDGRCPICSQPAHLANSVSTNHLC